MLVWLRVRCFATLNMTVGREVLNMTVGRNL